MEHIDDLVNQSSQCTADITSDFRRDDVPEQLFDIVMRESFCESDPTDFVVLKSLFVGERTDSWKRGRS